MRAPTPQGLAIVTRTDQTPPAPARVRTAAGTLPPNRRRPSVDDVIESGEIETERRSLVIRSSVQQVEIDNEPTEISFPDLPVPEKRSWRILWLAGALMFGVAAVVLLVRAKPATGNPALSTSAEMIGRMLDGEARATFVRADAIATSPALRYAIDTDAGTLADMARDSDVQFQLEAGDTLEIYQVRGTERMLMLRLPHNAHEVQAPAVGQARIEAANHRLQVVARAAIASERAKVAGEVVLSTPVDLAPLSKHLDGQTPGAVLTGLRDTVVLIANSTSPNVTIPITTKTLTAGTLALAAVVPQPTAKLAYAALVVSLLLVAGFIFSTVHARRRT
jgi:hypothetical protein